MENILTTIERENHIREIFLSMFREEGVSEEELEKAICESYCKEGIECKTIKDIPIYMRSYIIYIIMFCFYCIHKSKYKFF